MRSVPDNKIALSVSIELTLSGRKFFPRSISIDSVGVDGGKIAFDGAGCDSGGEDVIADERGVAFNRSHVDSNGRDVGSDAGDVDPNGGDVKPCIAGGGAASQQRRGNGSDDRWDFQLGGVAVAIAEPTKLSGVGGVELTSLGLARPSTTVYFGGNGTERIGNRFLKNAKEKAAAEGFTRIDFNRIREQNAILRRTKVKRIGL